MVSLGSLILLAGLVCLFYCGFVVHRGRKGLDVEEFEEYVIPIEVTLGCFVGVFLCIVGIVHRSPSFKPIDPAVLASKRSFDTCQRRPNLCTYYHRKYAFARLAHNFHE